MWFKLDNTTYLHKCSSLTFCVPIYHFTIWFTKFGLCCYSLPHLFKGQVQSSQCNRISNSSFKNFHKVWFSIFLELLLSWMYNNFRSAYILKQDSLPSSYKSFLNKHGGKATFILQGVKEIACGMPFRDLEVIEKHYKSMGVDIKLNPQMKVPCSVCILLSKVYCGPTTYMAFSFLYYIELNSYTYSGYNMVANCGFVQIFCT